MIAGTPQAAKVTHILFYGGKQASERWRALKYQVDQDKLDDADTVFKVFCQQLREETQSLTGQG